jgi:hypothetical protein
MITESAIAKLWIHNDIIIVKYNKNASVDLNASIKLMEDREALSNGKSYAVLADGRQALYWTSESRKFMAGKENNRSIKAVAVLVSSYIQKIWVNFYFKLNHPPVPTLLFTSETEALTWLDKFK